MAYFCPFIFSAHTSPKFNLNFFSSENRYLLILTENYAALRIMQQQLLKTSDNAIVIFGSSFPNDQEYTQVRFQYPTI